MQPARVCLVDQLTSPTRTQEIVERMTTTRPQCPGAGLSATVALPYVLEDSGQPTRDNLKSPEAVSWSGSRKAGHSPKSNSPPSGAVLQEDRKYADLCAVRAGLLNIRTKKGRRCSILQLMHGERFSAQQRRQSVVLGCVLWTENKGRRPHPESEGLRNENTRVVDHLKGQRLAMSGGIFQQGNLRQLQSNALVGGSEFRMQPN